MLTRSLLPPMSRCATFCVRPLLFGLASALLAGSSSAAMAQVVAGQEVAALDSEAQSRALAQSQLSAALARIAADAGDVDALSRAGRAALALGDARAALGFLGRAEALNSRDPVIKAALGAVMVQLEDPQSAMRYFDAAIANGGLDRTYMGDRGLAFDLMGDQRRAQADYAVVMLERPSAELTRRMAISLGISGEPDRAVQLLAPLLRAQDRSAWRARAMIVAMNGRAAEARTIAHTTMPPQLAVGLDNYWALMDRLTPTQLAFASHFGRFPTYEQVRNQPSRSEATRLASARAAAAVTAAASTGDPRRSRGRNRGNDSTRRNGRGAVQVASAAPVASPVSATTIGRDGLVPPPPPAPSAVPAASAPAATAPAPSVAPVFRSAPPPTPATPTPRPAPQPAPAVIASPPPTPAPAPVPVAAPTPAPVPVRVAVAGPPDVDASTGMARPPQVVAVAPSTIAPPASVAAASPPPTDVAIAAVSAPGPQPSVAAAQPSAGLPQPAAPPVGTTVVTGWSLDSMVGSLDVPATEAAASAGLTIDELQRIAAERRQEQAAAAAARAQAAADARARADAAAAARARSEATAAARQRAQEEAAARAEARAEAERLRRHPARIWVQVATGSNVSALRFDCRRFARDHEALFARQQCATAAWNRTNRLVVGPFRNRDAAQEWQRDFRRAGGSGFVWSSDAGEEVTPLPRR